MKSRQLRKVLALMLGASVLLVTFNNCGEQFKYDQQNLSSTSPTGSNGGQSSGGPLFQDKTACETDLMIYYSQSYQKFASTNCALCHVAGPGKGRFASSNLEDSYNDFMQTGYSKFSTNAISANHNPPASGPQHTQQINELRVGWQKALVDFGKCSGTTPTGDPEPTLLDKLALETTKKNIPAMEIGQTRVVTWTVNTEISSMKVGVNSPNYPGAMFSIVIGKYKTSGGETYYTFSQPKIYGANVDIRVKTLQVKLNGRLLQYPTTFRYLNASVRAGTMDSAAAILSTGSLVSPGVFSNSDQVSLAFESMETVVLPPQPPPVSVSLVGSPIRWVNPTTKTVNVEVRLSAPLEYEIAVTVSADMSGVFAVNETKISDIRTKSPALAAFICPAGNCAASAYELEIGKSIVGATYNRFDWDYKFASTSVSFAPGEVSRIAKVEFSSNVRHEANKLVVIQLDTPPAGVLLGAQKALNFIIDKRSNPKPALGEVTFSRLMSPTGALGENCLTCHNSVKREGKYDMSDYDLMIRNGVIIPGNIESKMYYRMNPASPNYIGAQPMPERGSIPTEKRIEVEQWILSGAKNN